MKGLRVLLLILFSGVALFAQSETVRHNIYAKVIPAKSQIEVTDTVTLPAVKSNKKITFELCSDLKITSFAKNVSVKKTGSPVNAKDVGMDKDLQDEHSLKVDKYEVKFKDKNEKSFWLKYSGKIYFPIESGAEEYQRGFGQTPGIISGRGVYLAGSSYWLPAFGERLVTFDLKTQLPAGWKSVSQGKRIFVESDSAKHIDEWVINKPQEEVFLIAAKFFEYKYDAGRVDVMAFLREDDEALANKYLETTTQYLQMYEGLLSKYPYSKFALVENFWETGYGMPSFTLLGQKIIRFPFILHSSYPHELLHNWWGNSAYVDFSQGNWCEGITAYMADHLIKEQRGQGAEYRRSTLQKFTDFVNEKNDFPLSKFSSRYDAPSEAIGYGKALMMWHMLRQITGDKNFVKAFRLFYNKNKFHRASFDDIRKAFEKVEKKNFKWFFDQWVKRTGAPEIKLGKIRVKKRDKEYTVSFALKQIQKGKPFNIYIPVFIQTKDSLERFTVNLSNKQRYFKHIATSEPLEILIDPSYDVFRKLNPKEIPPSLTRAYGSKETLIILPEKSEKNFDAYKNFAVKWLKTHREKFEIVSSDSLKEIPANKAVWVLGYKNKFLGIVNKQLRKRNSFVGNDSVKFAEAVNPTSGKDFICVVRNPGNVAEAVVWFAVGNAKAIDGLVRKLPHYGKYSYLAFEGDEPVNITKGEWNALNSPLNKKLSESFNGKVKIPKSKALAYLKPVFSAKKMFEHILYLASKELKGRGLGTPELEKAGNYIAEKFKEYGLVPGGDNGSYFQTWAQKVNDKKGLVEMRNVIGLIPGNDPQLDSEAVVVSAHYDHLGLGWPDVHKGDEGKIHPGADDNASGIAVLLELARTMAKSFKPSRTIIFVAFTGEEAGLLGSKHFVQTYVKFPKDKIYADLNLDTVGRLFGKKLFILNGNTAREWKFIFMGTDYVTGIPTDLVKQQLDASDQVSFINAKIPAVQFFSGPHPDYHRPTDTPDKIDKQGLVKVATVAKEVLEYLTERKEPLHFTGMVEKQDSEKPADRKARGVSTGTIPDFSFEGKGVKVGGVIPNSPAAKAGLRKGDVLIGFEGKEINDLRDYSNYLKTHKPGDVVEIEILRGSVKKKIKIKLAER